MSDTDPNGLGQHEPGAKLDQGKIQAGILQQFSRALNAIAQVGTFGANKYSRGGWLHVENGQERYNDAAWRHRLATEELDPESGLPHQYHEAWNVLAQLELKLIEEETKQVD